MKRIEKRLSDLEAAAAVGNGSIHLVDLTTAEPGTGGDLVTQAEAAAGPGDTIIVLQYVDDYPFQDATPETA